MRRLIALSAEGALGKCQPFRPQGYRELAIPRPYGPGLLTLGPSDLEEFGNTINRSLSDGGGTLALRII